MAEGHDACDNQLRSLPSSSSPLPSVCYSSFQTWLPTASSLWMNDRHEQDPLDPHIGTQLNELSLSNYLVCTNQSSTPLVSLGGGALTASSGPQSDVVKQGYLGKLERKHKRYFVLRAGSHTGPSRLEWYKNQEKFTAMEKSAGKAALFSSSKQGVIYLRCCLGVSRIGNSRKGHTVALYATDQTIVLVMEDQQVQEKWYLAIKKMVEEEWKNEEHGDEFEEEDDGYCTLPAAAFYKEVWPVTVKPRGLGRSKSLAGETRLCLTATSLILMRMSSYDDLPSVTIPLLSVRRFGHLDGAFFLELGRSAPNGPGEIWMEARDQGNSAIAQNIHEMIRETVRALRALPDFSRSPKLTINRPQALRVLKRSRPKHRDVLLNVRPPSSPLALPHCNPDIQSSPTKPHLESCNHKVEPESTLSFSPHLSPLSSQQSSTSETDSYVEMKTDHCNLSDWELGEEGERRGYMMMSPQVSHISSVPPQDDYVIMASPHKNPRSAFFSLHKSFSSSTSDGCSPLRPSRHQSEHSLHHWLVTSVRQWETQSSQSQTSISSTDAPQQEKCPQQRHDAMLSPVRSVDGTSLSVPFDISRAVYSRPVQAGPNSGTDHCSPLQGAQFKSVRRQRLSSCLPSCLQAEDRSSD